MFVVLDLCCVRVCCWRFGTCSLGILWFRCGFGLIVLFYLILLNLNKLVGDNLVGLMI